MLYIIWKTHFFSIKLKLFSGFYRFSSWKKKSIFSYFICGKRLTLTLLIAYSHFLFTHSKRDPCCNNHIYGVFIETRYFIFLAVLKNAFFQNTHKVQSPFSGNRPKKAIYLLRKQLSQDR